MKIRSILYLAWSLPLMFLPGNGRAENTTAVPSGYTWGHGDYTPGVYHPPANNGGNNPSAPALTPAQIAAQQKAAAQSAGAAINEKGITAFNQRDWKAAIDLFEQALQKWPENETIQKNLDAARGNLSAQQHHEQEVRVAASIRDQIGQFADSLKAAPVSGGLDFDGLRDGLVTKITPNPGLDFMVPGQSATATTAMKAAPQAPSSGLDWGDPNVVDLRDAKTLTVDPAKVKGSSTPPPDASVAVLAPSHTEVVPLAEYQAKAATAVHQLYQDPQWNAKMNDFLISTVTADQSPNSDKLQNDLFDYLVNEQAKDKFQKELIDELEKPDPKALPPYDSVRTHAALDAAFAEIHKRENKAVADVMQKSLAEMGKVMDDLKAKGLFTSKNFLDKLDHDPQFKQAFDVARKPVLEQQEKALRTVEEQKVNDIVSAGHQIVSLGKTSWTPPDSAPGAQ